MRRCLASLVLILILASCSNTPDLETGEIKTLQLLKEAFVKSKDPGVFINARNLLSREQVDVAKTPVLFVELESGQNGTLTPYPGRGIGQTWLGADGATITLEQGILKASRGLGDDLMGASSIIPPWSELINENETYTRELSYINGHNKIYARFLECKIKKNYKKEILTIWDVKFHAKRFEELCNYDNKTITNIYYVDDQGVVRRSFQYHSETIGYILTERLDR